MKMSQPDETEIDFSGGVRGRFYRPGSALIAPIHLEPALQAALQARADREGMALSDYVNLILKKDADAFEAAE